ncbi:MAG: protein tyrosine phosphatase family protein [Rubripirellula sp.]
MYRTMLIAAASNLAMSWGLAMAQTPQATSTPVVTQKSLASSDLGATKNVHAFGKILLCGQPTATEFSLARSRGIETVITLREPNEIDWDEPAAVRALGMKFHAIGFRAPDALTPELIERVLAVMADPEAGPVMLHCASANRVGALWMAHRVVNDGIDLEVAKQEARTIGLKTPGYETKVVDYLDQRRQAN